MIYPFSYSYNPNAHTDINNLNGGYALMYSAANPATVTPADGTVYVPSTIAASGVGGKWLFIVQPKHISDPAFSTFISLPYQIFQARWEVDDPNTTSSGYFYSIKPIVAVSGGMPAPVLMFWNGPAWQAYGVNPFYGANRGWCSPLTGLPIASLIGA